MQEAGKDIYSGYDWQLVQTHIIHQDGQIEALWRPGHNTGKADPERFNVALDKAIERLKLQASPAIPVYKNPRLEQAGQDGVALKVILRYPYQTNFPRNYTYTLDWIIYTSDAVSSLLPPVGKEDEPYEISSAVASDFMAHFRPFLDWGISEEYGVHDPHEQAVSRTKRASLTGTPMESPSPDTVLIGLQGSILMENLGEPQMAEDKPTKQWTPPNDEFTHEQIQHDKEKWIFIKSVDAKFKGYILMDASSREIQDFQIVLDSATLIAPNDKPIQYTGMARIVL